MRPNTTYGMSLLALMLFSGIACNSTDTASSTLGETTLATPSLTTGNAGTCNCDCSTGTSSSGSDSAGELTMDMSSGNGSSSSGGESSSTGGHYTGTTFGTTSWEPETTSGSSNGDMTTATTYGPVPTTGQIDFDCCELYGTLEDQHFCAGDFGDFCYFCSWEPTMCFGKVCTKDGQETECCLDEYGATVAC